MPDGLPVIKFCNGCPMFLKGEDHWKCKQDGRKTPMDKLRLIAAMIVTPEWCPLTGKKDAN